MGPEQAVNTTVITLAADGLRAHVTVAEGVPPPSVQELRDALALAGVIAGIQDDVLERIASGCQPPGSGPVVVASGTAPVHGENGRIEWLFSPGPGVKALYRNALRGQKIALVHAPTPGVPGMTVTGKPVAPAAGKPAHIHCGPNTSVDPADPSAIVASADGNIIPGDGSIEVQPVLTISGQVDYGTGNIDFSGSLVVTGEIRGDVTIRVKGSLTVKGSVEDADIQAGEDVTVEKGFVGRGKGRIAAGGSVRILHLLNQTVVAGKDVLIGRESVNGTVSAGGCIIAPNAVFAGGVLQSEGNITVNTIGSTDGLAAKVRAGKRGRILDRLTVLEREIKQTETQVGEIKDAIYRLVRLQIDKGPLDPEKKEMLAKLQAAQKQLPGRIEGQKAEQLDLKESLKRNQDVSVTVHETVFEHTMVDINGSKKIIEAALLGVVFRERNGAIEVSSC